jgi:uncharacterized membrane protein YeaQ/YmgE (transglycosylase-associated protein family)
MGIIIWLIVGAIAGWVAGKLVPGDEGYGVIGTIIVGIVGALVGGFIFGAVTGTDWITGFDIGTLVAAIVGAVIVVVVWQMITGRRSAA